MTRFCTDLDLILHEDQEMLKATNSLVFRVLLNKLDLICRIK